MPRHILLSTAILIGVMAASAASCGEVKYELKVAREGKAVTLSRSTGIIPSAAERDRRACEGLR